MHLISDMFFPGAASKARHLPTVMQRAAHRLACISALVLSAVCWVPLFVGAASPASPGKKLIEYGWDVPTPAQMREDLAAMEKRPFDGLNFRLSGGHNAFVTIPLEPASFAEDERILRSLQFTRFGGNFVLIWGSPPADFDWFNGRYSTGPR